MSFTQAFHLLASTNMLDRDDPDMVAGKARSSMETYEKTLYGLRDGEAVLKLKAIDPHDLRSLGYLHDLITGWENVQKPLFTDVLAAPSSLLQQSCRDCHAICDDLLPKVETLVASMDSHYTEELRHFDHARYIVLVIFSVIALGMAVFTKKKLIDPVKRLQAASLEIGQNNFKVSMAVESDDEIGYLTQTFNEMAGNLQTLFSLQEESLGQLRIVNRISSAVSSTIKIKSMLCEVLEEILALDTLSLANKGAFFLYDEKQGALHLTVSRNFSSEQCMKCDKVPSGECLCGLAVAENTVVCSDNSKANGRHTRTYQGMGAHGHIILPLSSGQKKLGVLCLYLQPNSRLDKKEKELLISIADIISISLENALSHQRLETLWQAFESSQDLIVVTDVEGNVTYVNSRVEEYLGLSPSEVLFRSIFQHHSANNLPGLDRIIHEKTMAGGWEGELSLAKSDGSHLPVLLSTSPVLDSEGTINGMVGIARDITQRKLLEEQVRSHSQNLEKLVEERTVELEKARDQAEAANRAKSDFLANMSHELRTPLNSIIGFSEIIVEEMAGPIADAQREYLHDIISSGRHLLSLINDILDLSKVESGHEELDLGRVVIADLVSHSLMLFKEKAMKHGIVLTADVATGIAAMKLDERKIRQVLVNLLANAMKFTPDGGQVLVMAAPEDDGVRFTVQDTGIGIAPEDTGKLFKPFQQLESKLSRKYPGTGLGLSLSRRFVEMHGGRIWVESRVGVGSSFIFVLPQEVPKPSPQRGSIDWATGRRHIGRMSSLGQRDHLQFALFRFQPDRRVSQDDFLATLEILQSKIREHDIIMAAAHRQVICLIVTGTARKMLDDALERFLEFLPENGWNNKRTAFFPEDGSSFSELVSALHEKGRRKPKDKKERNP